MWSDGSQLCSQCPLHPRCTVNICSGPLRQVPAARGGAGPAGAWPEKGAFAEVRPETRRELQVIVATACSDPGAGAGVGGTSPETKQPSPPLRGSRDAGGDPGRAAGLSLQTHPFPRFLTGGGGAVNKVGFEENVPVKNNAGIESCSLPF